jgi:hypothetical protein
MGPSSSIAPPCGDADRARQSCAIGLSLGRFGGATVDAMTAPHAEAGRVADILLRGTSAPITARLVWPAHSPTRPPLVVLFLGGAANPASSAVPNVLSRQLGALVLACAGSTAFPDGARALEWAADHGLELGADPQQLAIAGEADGCFVAAAVAAHARDEGWPPMARQILIRPPDSFPLNGSMTGIAVDVVQREEDL